MLLQSLLLIFSLVIYKKKQILIEQIFDPESKVSVEGSWKFRVDNLFNFSARFIPVD